MYVLIQIVAAVRRDLTGRKLLARGRPYTVLCPQERLEP
jgi:hypothetical protein